MVLDLHKTAGFSFDPDKQPQLTVNWHIPRFANRTGRFVTFQLPKYCKLEDIFRFSSRTRQAPYLFRTDQFIRLSYRITGAENYTLIRNTYPEQTALSGIYWRRDYHRDGMAHCLDYLLQIRSNMSDPAIFPRLTGLSGDINHNDSKMILFVTE